MPQSCGAVGCTNRKIGDKKGLPFYNILKGKTPIEKRRREAWIKAIRREDWKKWPEEHISKAKICAEHFVTGRRSDDPENVNWIPTIFSHTTAREHKKMKVHEKRRKRYEDIKIKKKALAMKLPFNVISTTKLKAKAFGFYSVRKSDTLVNFSPVLPASSNFFG
eukprot:gene6493-7237_t